MSKRSSIKNALIEQINNELTAANEGTIYYTDIDKNTLGDAVFADSVEVFPAITVILGPERTEYLPSGFRWQYLTMYLRAHVKSEDETEEQLEELISDIKTFIDNFERLDYTVTNPDGTDTIQTVTQITTVSITTDEGLLKPLGMGEINVEVRYSERSKK
jgi:hypothetical protein